MEREAIMESTLKLRDEKSIDICKALDLDPSLVKDLRFNLPVNQVYTVTVELFITEAQYRQIFRK